MPSNQSASWGARAERAAARKYRLERRPGPGYDLRSPRNGTRYQVKSADVAREQPRCRFWLPDHLKLVRAPQACYIVVSYSSESARVKNIQKVPLARVAALGEWGPSGHSGGKGRQKKLALEELQI